MRCRCMPMRPFSNLRKVSLKVRVSEGSILLKSCFEALPNAGGTAEKSDAQRSWKISARLLMPTTMN